jgi:hypothetical protein
MFSLIFILANLRKGIFTPTLPHAAEGACRSDLVQKTWEAVAGTLIKDEFAMACKMQPEAAKVCLY